MDIDYPDFLIKIITVGDSGVGKTNLLARYAKRAFNEHSNPTIGIDFVPKTMTVRDLSIKVQFWDTAGQEKYRSMTTIFYKNTDGVVLVYDITRPETFNNLTTWLGDIREYLGEDLTAIIIGNKTDLNEERAVTTEEAMEFAKNEGLFFMECSALTNAEDSVDKAFMMLIDGKMS